MVLKGKQQLFVDRYLVHRNGTRAAIEAGYSERTARVIAAENLTKLNIKAEIEQRTAAEAMAADEVLQRLARHARSSMADFISIPGEGEPGDPCLDLQNAAKLELLDLLKEFTIEERTVGEATTRRISIKLYDAQSALSLLGKNLGLLSDKVDVKLTRALEQALDVLEKELDSDTYDRILSILAGTFGAASIGAPADGQGDAATQSD